VTFPDRPDDLLALGDRQRNDLRFEVVRNFEPFGGLLEAGLARRPGELQDFRIGNGRPASRTDRSYVRMGRRSMASTGEGKRAGPAFRRSFPFPLRKVRQLARQLLDLRREREPLLVNAETT
jgi:hypothetical protein